MLHSGCVKLHQKFRDFVGLPMGLLREESPKNRMNTGLFGSRSGEVGFIAGLCPNGNAHFRKLLELGAAIEDGFCDPTGSGGVVKLTFDIPFDLLEVA